MQRTLINYIKLIINVNYILYKITRHFAPSARQRRAGDIATTFPALLELRRGEALLLAQEVHLFGRGVGPGQDSWWTISLLLD